MTPKQHEAIQYLLDTVIPWMQANPGRVDMSECFSECGTYACLGGWYCYMRYQQTDPWIMSRLLNEDFYNKISSIWNTNDPIFGDERIGPLEDRVQRLKEWLTNDPVETPETDVERAEEEAVLL